MNNMYEVPEVIEIGKAKDLILGNGKPSFIVDDGAAQPKSEDFMSDDE